VPTVLRTPRLRLRPPTPADDDFLFALHSDPQLYAHAPWARTTDRAISDAMTQLWRQHWRDEGFGYFIVEAAQCGAPIGVAGVRRAAAGRLNLYYRFAAATHGSGLGREAARAAVVAHATEWFPQYVVEAVIRPDHWPSVRTAEAVGMVAVGERQFDGDPPEAGASWVFELPRIARVDDLAAALREPLLDLWQRVTDAGGSVGFLPGAPRERIAEALAEHAAEMTAGHAVAVSLTDPDGSLSGWGWWTYTSNPLLAHGRWLYRFMIEPARQGRHLGATLLAGMIGAARRDGAELLELGYRSGSGLGDFYALAGFVEVGRIPGAIRVGPGDFRDDVTMARRVDGSPLVYDGRH